MLVLIVKIETPRCTTRPLQLHSNFRDQVVGNIVEKDNYFVLIEIFCKYQIVDHTSFAHVW
jgi:hypothetical protein